MTNHTTRITATIAASVLALTAVSGGIAFAQHRTAKQIAEVTTQVVQAQTDEHEAVKVLTTMAAGAQALLDQTKDKVADDALRQRLAAVLAQARDEKVDAAGVAADHGLVEARAALDAARAEAAKAKDAASALRKAVVSVQRSHAAFLLDQATQAATDAKTRLDETIAAGAAVLAESENKVTDNAVREALAAALDAAQQVTDAAVDAASRKAQDAAARARTDASASVESTTAAVNEAVAAKAEADRQAKAKQMARENTAAAKKNASGTNARAAFAADASEGQAQSGDNGVDAEAARFGLSVVWQSLGGATGYYSESSPSVIYIDPMVRGYSAANARSVVRHEAAHAAIDRICGTIKPPIAGSRWENVTTAYADMYHGGVTRSAYGVNAQDRDAATQIHAGQCTAAQDTVTVQGANAVIVFADANGSRVTVPAPQGSQVVIVGKNGYGETLVRDAAGNVGVLLD